MDFDFDLCLSFYQLYFLVCLGLSPKCLFKVRKVFGFGRTQLILLLCLSLKLIFIVRCFADFLS